MLIKILKWSLFTLAAFIIVIVAGSFIFNRHLAQFIEGRLNKNVKGYQFVVGAATFLPDMSLEIKRLKVIQTDHPDPPVAEVPRWKLGIQWQHIFSGVIVSDYLIDHPKVHITLPNLTKEADDFEQGGPGKDKVPFHEKGWREAVYSFYPFKINQLRVVDGDVVYVDQDSSRPLHLTNLNFTVGNIRNIRFPNDSYPSDFMLDGNLFGSGRVQLSGRANFLSEPNIGINANLALLHVALEPLLPVTEHYNFHMTGGVLSGEGHLEYTAKGETKAELKSLTVENAKVDFVHAAQTKEKEARMGKTTVQNVEKLKNDRVAQVSIERAEIKNSEFGFVNKEAKKPYRIFLSNTNLEIQNISNSASAGIGMITLSGDFMGTGGTRAVGRFRPKAKSPDFDLDTKIVKTKMRAMSDLFRAYGNFDVASGLFSLYAQLNVKDGKVTGYIKPLFKEMKVYDARQDKEKSLFHQLYVGLVRGVAKLLENPEQKDVATKTDIKGDVEQPKASTWETVGNLIKNAFFKAILPGFEKQVVAQK